MQVSDFDFDLPRRFIAQRPATPRDSARMLVVGRGFRDLGVADLPRLLRSGDVMVYNDTQVIPARLSGRKEAPGGSGDTPGPGSRTGMEKQEAADAPDAGGARIEVTLLKPDGGGVWRAMARPARRLKPKDRVAFAPGGSPGACDLIAEVVAKGEDGEVTLRFPLAPAELLAALDARGIMPLPPYIKRGPEGDARDREDYQTLFAVRPGAVAAPTAGLHFTPALVRALQAGGVELAPLTLHVGAGTFLPVKAADTRDHRMHAEWGEITAETADTVNAARAAGGRVAAVGSTALRLLETAAGDDGRLAAFSGETDIFITPGYRFRIVDVLLTNFHLPRSTLFMLVSAFSGLERMKAAYEHAKAAGYRFYSYGDACLLERRSADADGREEDG